MTARLGDHRSKKCHTSAFPVWLHNQPAWIEAGTHLLLDKPDLAPVDCSAVFPPYIQSKEGEILIADPYVRTEKIALNTLPTFLEPINMDSWHQEFSESLLYTSEEINKFNNLVHFSRTRERVVDALAHRYCEANEDCGSFKPPTGSSSFDVQALANDLTHPVSYFWRKALAWATKTGSLCSLLIVAAFLLSTIHKACRVFDYVRNRRVRPTEAMRLVFAPGNALAQCILESQHPPPQPSAPASYYTARNPLAAEAEAIELSLTNSGARDQPPIYPGVAGMK